MALPPIELNGQRSPRQRMWRGRLLSAVEEVRMYFDDQGPVTETFRKLRERLAEAGLPHIFMGAVCAERCMITGGHLRTWTSACALKTSNASAALLSGRCTSKWPDGRGRFYDPVSQVTFDVLVAGEIAGNARKQQKIRFPGPSEAETVRDTPVPNLRRLVELKLVTWRYKDRGDVVELIRVHDLDGSFADQLDPTVRTAYLQCFDQKVEEDRYNPEIDDPPASP